MNNKVINYIGSSDFSGFISSSGAAVLNIGENDIGD